MNDVQLSQGQEEQTAYLPPLRPQEYLVLISSTSEG